MWNSISHQVHIAHYTYMLGFSKAGMKFISFNICIMLSVKSIYYSFWLGGGVQAKRLGNVSTGHNFTDVLRA